MSVFQTLDYYPFPEQLPFHQSDKDVIQVIGAEGAGKSQVLANEVTVACLAPKWARLVYLIGDTYLNPRKEFQYIEENLIRLGYIKPNQASKPQTGKWSVTTCLGTRIETLSVQEGASAVIATGQEADVYCLCEAGIIDSFSVFTACVRRATRNQGRVLLSGTLKDNFGWYASLIDDLRVPDNIFRGEVFNWPAWINTLLYPKGKVDPEILRLKEILPKDEFDRTIAAKRTIPPVLVFGKDFSYSQNVKECRFDPSKDVTLAFDPGYSVSAYAVGVFQFTDGPDGDEIINQIDELYLHGHTHEMVIEICKSKEWYNHISRVVADIAAKQHQASKSGVEIWKEQTGFRVHSRPVKVADGISAHRSALKRLRHDPSCKHTLNEYKLYRLPSDKDGNPTSDKPLDKDNHSMKMIAYMLVDRYGLKNRSLKTLATASIDWYSNNHNKVQEEPLRRSEEEIEALLNA